MRKKNNCIKNELVVSKMGFILCLHLVLTSCAGKYTVYTNIAGYDKKVRPLAKVLVLENKLRIADADSEHKKVLKTNSFKIVPVIWSDSCYCGLVDVARGGYRTSSYYPYLVTANQEIIPVVGYIPNKYVAEDNLPTDQMRQRIKEFKETNGNLFTSEEFFILDHRMQQKIIYLGGSLLLSNIYGDELLMNIYVNTLKLRITGSIHPKTRKMK